jgi:predicted nucleotidyltransferase component of viral defense system
MLDLPQILSFFPPHLRAFRVSALREYLQYKILASIFGRPHGRSLAFMGGTALRIIYGNPRFSEDLDFDNRGLDGEGLSALAASIRRDLERAGFRLEVKVITKGAWHVEIRFLELLAEMGLSGHREEKILVSIDLETQDFSYRPDPVIINRFDVFANVAAVPPDILLSQKIAAVFTRKRALGRDLYDIVFLFGKTRPNAAYLKDKLGFASLAEAKRELSAWAARRNLAALARDVEPFLFDSADKRKVLLFREFIEKTEFSGSVP